MPGCNQAEGTATVRASERGCETWKAFHGPAEGRKVTHPAGGAVKSFSCMVAQAGVSELFPAATTMKGVCRGCKGEGEEKKSHVQLARGDIEVG